MLLQARPDLASLHRVQGLLLWIRLASGLAPGRVCVKANEAGLAARAARVRSKARGAAAGPSAAKEEQEEMAGQGQQQMTQEELNEALSWACGEDNDQARAEELLGRGADQHALAVGIYNALHLAAHWGREQVVAMLLSRGAILEARTGLGGTALLLAALNGKPEVCLLLIAKEADLRVRSNNNRSALSHYGHWARPPPSIPRSRRSAWRSSRLPSALAATLRRCSGARTRTGRSAGP